jgi:hypothetical protein
MKRQDAAGTMQRADDREQLPFAAGEHAGGSVGETREFGEQFEG